MAKSCRGLHEEGKVNSRLKAKKSRSGMKDHVNHDYLDCSQSSIFPSDFRDSYASTELPPSL